MPDDKTTPNGVSVSRGLDSAGDDVTEPTSPRVATEPGDTDVATDGSGSGVLSADAAAVTGEDDLAPGSVTGDYCIRAKIGWGGCSIVYAAENLKDGQEVAVKVMHRGLSESPRQVQRFVQEAQAVRLIHHPAIVEVFDIGRLDDGRPYIVMELLQGTNLATLLRNQGRLSPNEAFEILEPVGAALTMAHEAGIIHRDIKASNIIVQGGDGQRRVKLLDFGIAKLVGGFSAGSMQTTVGHVLGTPHSMAPEQIKGKPVDGRTDIYALGALLYRLLTGRHPFEGHDALSLTRMHIHTQPPLPSRSAPVSPAVDAVVRTAMEKDPARRYQTVEDFVDGLREAVGAQRRESQAMAFGVYVEGRMPGEGEPDDAMVDDLMTVLDTTEDILDAHGFAIPLVTSHAVLGAIVVAVEDIDAERRKVLAVAAELDRALSERPDADQRVSINICLHLAEATVVAHAERPELVGGPIIDIGSWAPSATLSGVCATVDMVGHLFGGGPSARRPTYVRIDLGRE